MFCFTLYREIERESERAHGEWGGGGGGVTCLPAATDLKSQFLLPSPWQHNLRLGPRRPRPMATEEEMFFSLTPQRRLQRPQTLAACVKHSHYAMCNKQRAHSPRAAVGPGPRWWLPSSATRLSPFTSRRGNQIIKCEKQRQEEEVCVWLCQRVPELIFYPTLHGRVRADGLLHLGHIIHIPPE